MKKFMAAIALIFAFGLFFIGSVPVHAAGSKPVLRVGYTDSPGYITKGEDGYFGGFIFDYLEAIAIYGGYEFEYIDTPPTDLIEKLMSGEIDLIAALPEMVPPLPGIITTHHAVTFSQIGITAHPGKTLTPGQKLRIGYPSFIYPTEDIRNALNIYGLKEGSDFILVPANRLQDVITDYQNEKLDAYVDSTVYHGTGKPMVAFFFTKPFYIATREDHKNILDKIDHSIADLMLLNPHFRGQLYAEHAGQGMPLLLTPDEKEYLASHPVISAAASPGQKPYTYFEDNEAKGVIQEIIQCMEKDLGVRFEVRETQNSGELIQLLTGGEIEVVNDYYADHNWAHLHNAVLTFPYLTINYVPVMQREKVLPEKPVIACAKNHFYTHKYVEQTFPPEQLAYYDTIDECMEAVNCGNADLTFVKAITIQHDIEQGNYLNLYTNGSVVFSHKVSLAVSDTADPRLVRILNKEINHLGTSPVNKIITRHSFETEQEQSFKAYIARHPWEFTLFLTALLLSIIGGLLYVINLRQHSAKKMHDLAYHNQQTDLTNVRWFEEAAEKIIKCRSKDRKAGRLFVMVLSTQRIDLLKASLNPEAVASGIRELVERSRKTHSWMLADGLSSELTHLYVLGCLSDEMTLHEAAEVFARTASLLSKQGYDIHMNYHFGLRAVPADEDLNITQLMADADTAQMEAIETGGYIGIFDEKLQQKRLKQKKIAQIMQKALANNEFQIWLQPKYDIRTQQIIGAEALTRWQSPELGFIMPGLFISVFEKNGFILEFDYYVLEHVCQLQRQRIDEGKPVIPFSVNQSGLHIREPGYLDRLRGIMERYQLPPKSIDLEITETAFVDFNTQEGRENSASIIAEMKALGFTISMDDFCTGYSSVAMLQHLDMDVMKIDRAMLLASEASDRGKNILRQIIALGKDLGMLVLCEGVETKEQETLLMESGCFHAQGFLFGRPKPADEFFASMNTSSTENA